MYKRQVFDVEKKISAGLMLSGPPESKARRAIRGVCLLHDSWLVTVDMGTGVLGTQWYRFIPKQSPGDWPWQSESVKGCDGIIVGGCCDGKILGFVRSWGSETKEEHGALLKPVDLELHLIAEGKVIRKLKLRQVMGKPVLDPAGKHVAFVRSRPKGGREVVVRAIDGDNVSIIPASKIIGITSTTVVVQTKGSRLGVDSHQADIAVFSFDGSEMYHVSQASGGTVCGGMLYFYSESTNCLWRVRIDAPQSNLYLKKGEAQ
mgnify:CR=1 FL=1